MVISDLDRETAEVRMNERLQAHPRAVRARYDRRTRRILIHLDTGLEIAFRSDRAEGLQGASDDDLAQIEISPTGHGLHWPALDADIYIPGLLAGSLGARAWLRHQLSEASPRAKRKTA
jgi:hypothetical protein